MEEIENKPTKQEKHTLRVQERENQHRRLAFKNQIKKFLIWLILIILLGLVIDYSLAVYRRSAALRKEENKVSEVKGEYFQAQNRDHIKSTDSHPAYNSNPPTGGWHWENPIRSGIYDHELVDEQIVHNLEHGHVWITYKPALDKTTIAELETIAKDIGSKIVVSPRAKNDSMIAVMAWEYLLKLDHFDKNQILGFIKAHRGKGPENVPDMGF